MRLPPLSPLKLHGFQAETRQSARLLTSGLAEEIRILIPDRQRIEENWHLVYSLEEDGVSLGTLYEKCAPYVGSRAGFVLVVRDNDGAVFGAYLSDPPHPAPHYFGNGECFLWRASILASLPPPPSSDTTHLARMTTIPGTQAASQTTATSSMNGLVWPSTPSIRFKAFPHSGENEFYVYCEPHWLSVGGGSGHYGLWLDASLEKGISSTCPTFGNEPLSDEGEKFGVLGVEIWMIGTGL